ncbi:hypothetical protein SynMVIR181_02627 [Synechococcus sp. MVIR-18-1]|nr:hypothetical protein SynMVIR181_02627 [Synechococcus sp. MVIR-18-1]
MLTSSPSLKRIESESPIRVVFAAELSPKGVSQLKTPLVAGAEYPKF